MRVIRCLCATALCLLPVAAWAQAPKVTFNNFSAGYTLPAPPNAQIIYKPPVTLSNGANFYSTGGTLSLSGDAGCAALAVGHFTDRVIVAGQGLTGNGTCRVIANYPGSTPVAALLTYAGTTQTISSITIPPGTWTTVASPAPTTIGYTLGWPSVAMNGGITFLQGGGTLALGVGRNCADFSLINGVLSWAVNGLGAATYTCSLVATDPSASNSPQTQSFNVTVYTPGTTFFVAGDCADPGLSLSNGGLTITANVSSFNVSNCRANTSKYTGKWYYEAAVTGSLGSGQAIGLANNGNGRVILGGWPPGNINQPLGSQANAVGLAYGASNSALKWANISTPPNGLSGLPGYALGKTMAIAIDLDADPHEIWVTLDVNGTSGFGGGPLWNGSNTSSPTVPGTGSQLLIPDYQYSPAASFQFTGGGQSVTFNFGASTFAGTVPSGFASWNAAGGAAPNPGPGNPLTINIANAPGWQASHRYVAGDRIVAGPGWSPGSPGSFASGQPLYLWATNTGGTSGSSQPAGFAACGSAAGYGGGIVNPTSAPAQWSGKTQVSDNGVTWICLTSVDYHTLTGMNFDDVLWAPNTDYLDAAIVVNSGNAYFNNNFGTTTRPYTCTSAPSGGGPIATGSSIADGTCNWSYQGPIAYSSRAHRWPHQHFPQGRIPNGANGEFSYNYQVNLVLWYGGKEGQVYQPGKVYQTGEPAENDPIFISHHGSFYNDTALYCKGGYLVTPIRWASCSQNGDMGIFTPAPGDGFRDNINPATDPLAFDSTKGVAIYSTTAWVWGGLSAPGNKGDVLTLDDNSIGFDGIQMKSTQGPVLDAFNGPGDGNSDVIFFKNGIMDAGGGFGVTDNTSSWSITNSLLIYRGTQANGYAILSKYPTEFSNDTIVGPGVANCPTCVPYKSLASGIGTWAVGSLNGPPPLHNNIYMGWADMQATVIPGFGTTAYTNSWNNATDLPSSYAGGRRFTDPRGTNTLTTFAWPKGFGNTCGAGNAQTCYSLNPANQFVSVPTPSVGGDLRIKNTSADIYGAGGRLITGYVGGFNNPLAGTYNGIIYTGRDIYGTARPQSRRYDIGVVEYLSGGNKRQNNNNTGLAK